MIIVKLQGGLGNQMFQYALGRALSLKQNTPFKLDIGVYKNENHLVKRFYALNIFNIKENIVSEEEIPFLHKIYLNGKLISRFLSIFKRIFVNKGKEKFFHFDPEIFTLRGNLYLDGYWQSLKYFEGYEEIIKKDFTLKNSPSEDIRIMASEIQDKNSLCIHVRRGDYVGNKYHDVVNMDYYKKGLEYIKSKVNIDKIYVFSDDIDWCRKNVNFGIEAMFVGEEYAGKYGEGHMYLMGKCKNFIIANSSFSWWGAWLSEYSDKIVVCPRQWFGDSEINTSDLIPKEWIRI